jgi:hypothetical protein
MIWMASARSTMAVAEIHARYPKAETCCKIAPHTKPSAATVANPMAWYLSAISTGR